MEIFQRIIGFFQTTDNASQAIMIWAAFVALVASLRSLLVLIAPLTKTKLDDKCASWLTKCYDVLAKTIAHQKKDEK